MIQIRVCAGFFAVFTTLCTFVTAEVHKTGDESQRGASAGTAESKSDKEHYEAGRSFEEQGQYEVCEFRTISAQLQKTHYYNDLGFCLENLRRYDDAIEIFGHVISLDPKDSYAHRELGVCYYRKQQLERSIDSLQQAVSLNSSDAIGHRWLGYAFYRLKKYNAAIDALDLALKLKPDDYDANYWEGLSFLRAGRFEEASRSLGKAVALRPPDFDANFWRGASLVRARKFPEAISSFEKAWEIRPHDQGFRAELFACYVATQQFQKAFELFPLFVAVLGSALVMIYVVGFVFLLAFSLPKRSATSPGLGFSIAWLALFFVGQIAFLLLLTLCPPVGLNESVFSGIMIAALPIILVATVGFARQPWGSAFQWPLRFGPGK